MNRPVEANGENLAHAAAILRSGGIVAFPTETYYGLAVDPFNRKGLERLFAVKKRPQRQPILVLVETPAQIDCLASSLPSLYPLLMRCFWPGPLTLVCPARPTLPEQLTGGTGTVGIRQSPAPTAQALLKAFGGPLTATSANISGTPAAVTAAEVERMFGADIDLNLDGGPTPGGQGSTLVGMDGADLVCLRAGKILFSAVQECIATH